MSLDFNTSSDEKWVRHAIELGLKKMRAGEGGPFGAVVVDAHGKLVAEGWNRVLSTNDPTAHAEVQAIRLAASKLENYQLTGCTLYSSCEPCPMCLGAIYWARPARLVFAASRQDAANGGFDDDFIYREIPLPISQRRLPTRQILQSEATPPFQEWLQSPKRKEY